MPYVTSIERFAHEEGVQEGRQEGLAEGLQIAILEVLEGKFKKVAAKQAAKVRSLRDLDRLRALLRAASHADTLDDALSLIRER